MNSLPPVDAHQLADRLASLLGEERSVLVEFLRHLARFDADALYAGFGYRSLFVYCTDRLRLSKSATFRRITTARLMRRFPIIEDFLSDGRLCLTRVCMLKDVLTSENHADLLQRAAAGSEEDVEVLVATHRPSPVFADSVRKVPVRRQLSDGADSSPGVGSGAEPLVLGAGGCGAEPDGGNAQRTGTRTEVGSAAEPNRRDAQVGSGAEPLVLGAGGSGAEPIAASAPARARGSRVEVEPLNATMYAVRMCVDRAFLDELEAVRAALSHKFPDGSFENVLRECFRITLEACARRRCGSERRAKTSKTQAQSVEAAGAANVEPHDVGEADCIGGAASLATDERDDSVPPADPYEREDGPSRYIPVKVRRAVWKRDGGRCAFISTDGKRCGSNWQVDFHHCDPYANGGPPTVDNISLRCRTHNLYEADLAFGVAFMRKRVTEARRRRSKSVPPRNQIDFGPADVARVPPDGLGG